jgi:S1-C subfamily serine protease
LEPAPKPGRDDVLNLSGDHPFDGARVSNILPSVVDEFELDETEGVVIVAVRSGGAAARLGFRPGDVIVRVGSTEVSDVAALDEITRKPQRMWRLAIKRSGRLINLQFRG